jgi:hypothetical protein
MTRWVSPQQYAAYKEIEMIAIQSYLRSLEYPVYSGTTTFEPYVGSTETVDRYQSSWNGGSTPTWVPERQIEPEGTVFEPPTKPPIKPVRRKSPHGFSMARRVPRDTQSGRRMWVQQRRVQGAPTGRPCWFLKVKQRSSNRARTRTSGRRG